MSSNYNILRLKMLICHYSLTIILLQDAMRRCGHNPTDIEVSDIINKIHDDSGSLNFEVRLGVFF